MRQMPIISVNKSCFIGFLDLRTCWIIGNHFYRPSKAFLAAAASDSMDRYRLSQQLKSLSERDLRDFGLLINYRRPMRSNQGDGELQRLRQALERAINGRQLIIYRFDRDLEYRLRDRNDPLSADHQPYRAQKDMPVDGFTRTLADTLAETTEHYKKAQQGSTGSIASPLRFNSQHPNKQAFERVGTLPIKITRHQVSSPDTIAGKPTEQLSIELDKLDVTYDVPWGLSNKQQIKNLLNEGFRRWRELLSHQPSNRLLYDYFNESDPEIKERLDPYYHTRGTYYEYPLSVEVILALGLAGNQKLGSGTLQPEEAQQYVGPFSYKALDEIADLADHITREATQKTNEAYLLAKSQSYVSVPKTYWVELKVEDNQGEPIIGQAWWIKTPDGAVHTGVTSAKGTARVAEVGEDGPCYLKFPGASNILLNGNQPPPPAEGTAGTYAVQQGDTLARIAEKNGIGRVKDIYEHTANAGFRRKRPNPNIIYPGDKLVIPEPSDKPFRLRMGMVHEFMLYPEKERFKVTLKDPNDTPLKGKRAVLTLGKQVIDTIIGDNGLLEVELVTNQETEAQLEVYMLPGESQPTHNYTLKLAHLDPVETLSGIQARCNNLGSDCGGVDGIMGKRTEAGVKEFQEKYKLEVDGKPGPITQAKLIEIYKV